MVVLQLILSTIVFAIFLCILLVAGALLAIPVLIFQDHEGINRAWLDVGYGIAALFSMWTGMIARTTGLL